MQDIAASIYVDPGDRDRLKTLLKEHGSVSDFEFRMRRRDGEILTVMESSIATRDAAGNVLGYQGFVLDVTERKRAELEIRRRNRELMVLNSIGQTLNQPLGMQDISGRVLRQVVELFSVDIASIFLIQPNSTILQILAGAGFVRDMTGIFHRWPSRRIFSNTSGPCTPPCSPPPACLCLPRSVISNRRRA